ncbi:MAG: cobalamin-dependent protein [Candidatus Odinarchaeota archaeon]|nr:cobalamin-dependent protein [Candidatus Odinarchaeota archaeon]
MSYEYDVVLIHPIRNIKSTKKRKIKSLIFKRSNYIRIPPFMIVPVGLFIMATKLKERNFSVKIINLPLEVELSGLKIEKFFKKYEARVFGISLHWSVHTSGAIEIARILKTQFPESKIVLGGLTATYFAQYIMENYEFIDAVILGEGEDTLIDYLQYLDKNKTIDSLHGILLRNKEGKIEVKKERVPPDYENTKPIRIDSLEHWEEYLKADVGGYDEIKDATFWISIARGCIFNCAYCGAGCNSYSIFSNREKLAIRKIEYVADEIEYLESLGVRVINFNYDPSILGPNYYKKLFGEIRKRKIEVGSYIELFRVATSDFYSELNKTFIRNIIAFSPETGSEKVRFFLGRKITDDALEKSIIKAIEHGLFPHIYFMAGLPGESEEDFKKTTTLIEKLKKNLPVTIFGGYPYIVDVGSPMFRNPEKYKVRLLFNSFNDFYNLSSLPDVVKTVELIGYETEFFSRKEIATKVNQLRQYVDSVMRKHY